MNKSDTIRLYIKNNPNSFVREIADATGFNVSLISQVLNRDWRNGHVIRDDSQLYFRYSLKDGAFSHLDAPFKEIDKSALENAIIQQVISKIDIDDVIENIAIELAVKVLDYVKSEFKELPKIQAVLDKPDNWAKVDIKTKDKPKMRIGVVGVLPNQAKILQKEFGDNFDIRFWTKDQSAQQLSSLASNSDYTVVMVSKIGHWAYETVSKHSNNYVSVSGGISQIRQCINSQLIN